MKIPVILDCGTAYQDIKGIKDAQLNVDKLKQEHNSTDFLKLDKPYKVDTRDWNILTDDTQKSVVHINIPTGEKLCTAINQDCEEVITIVFTKIEPMALGRVRVIDNSVTDNRLYQCQLSCKAEILIGYENISEYLGEEYWEDF